MARNCHFKYRDTNNKTKNYEDKFAELKIELYDAEDGGEGKRVGKHDLNLSQFIGRGIQTLTFAMDKDQKVYLTVKISVLSSHSGQDIATLALAAIKTNR